MIINIVRNSLAVLRHTKEILGQRDPVILVASGTAGPTPVEPQMDDTPSCLTGNRTEHKGKKNVSR